MLGGEATCRMQWRNTKELLDCRREGRGAPDEYAEAGGQVVPARAAGALCRWSCPLFRQEGFTFACPPRAVLHLVL